MKRKNEIIGFSIIVALIISIIGVFATIGVKLIKDSNISSPDFSGILSWFSKEEEDVYVEVEEITLKYKIVVITVFNNCYAIYKVFTIFIFCFHQYISSSIHISILTILLKSSYSINKLIDIYIFIYFT